MPLDDTCRDLHIELVKLFVADTSEYFAEPIYNSLPKFLLDALNGAKYGSDDYSAVLGYCIREPLFVAPGTPPTSEVPLIGQHRLKLKNLIPKETE